ncbi:MAG: transporter heme permease [Pseudomonadota bacterium]
MLHRRVDGEHVELVHLAELGAHRCGGGHVAHLPAGHVVGLAEARDDEGARRQPREARRALMLLAIEHHVLVHLVADQQHVGGCQDVLQAQHVFARPDGGARVVRRVDQDGAGARRDGGCNLVEVRPERAGNQRHAHRGAAGQIAVGDVAVVARLEHDHFVARAHHGKDGGDDRLGGARGDGDLGVRVVAFAVKRLDLAADRLAQHRHAGHWRVLVQALEHGVGDGVDQARIALEVGEALPEVDRVLLGGQSRHHGEDGGAHGGQLGLKHGGGEAHGVHRS